MLHNKNTQFYRLTSVRSKNYIQQLADPEMRRTYYRRIISKMFTRLKEAAK